MVPARKPTNSICNGDGDKNVGLPVGTVLCKKENKSKLQKLSKRGRRIKKELIMNDDNWDEFKLEHAFISSYSHSDSESYEIEMAELYCYAENFKMRNNVTAFMEYCRQWKTVLPWTDMTELKKSNFVSRLVNELDVVIPRKRLAASRALLYIGQGLWGNHPEIENNPGEHWDLVLKNTTLLLKNGVVTSMMEIVGFEMEILRKNDAFISTVMKQLQYEQVTVALNILYTILETVRCSADKDKSLHELLVSEIADAVDMIVIQLFELLQILITSSSAEVQIKKTVLILWKILLIVLGNEEEMKKMYNYRRSEAGLPPVKIFNSDIGKWDLKPPPRKVLQPKDNFKEKEKKPKDKSQLKEKNGSSSWFIDTKDYDFDFGAEGEGDESKITIEDIGDDEDEDRSTIGNVEDRDKIIIQGVEVEEENIKNARKSLPDHVMSTALLKSGTKVREQDMELFFEKAYSKYLDFKPQEFKDWDSVIGFPGFVQESIRIQKSLLYKSLGEWQLQQEGNRKQRPFTSSPEEPVIEVVEKLYQHLFPNLKHHVTNLISTLELALTLSEFTILPHDLEYYSFNMGLNKTDDSRIKSRLIRFDKERCGEIITKAVSAIIMLLLKHFKLNHICQYEVLSQHLVFGNSISVFLRYFFEEPYTRLAPQRMELMEYPKYVLGGIRAINTETIFDTGTSSGRNLFSCINMLRAMNKLVKRKNVGTIILNRHKIFWVFRSWYSLPQRHIQLYVAKLLKIQSDTKCSKNFPLKSQAHIITTIYRNVKTSINGYWIENKEPPSNSADSYLEDCIEHFHRRRYYAELTDKEWIPGNYDFMSAYHNTDVQFSKIGLESWIQQELYNSPIPWDEFLAQPSYP